MHAIGRLLEVLNFIVYSNNIYAKATIGENTFFYHHGLGCVIHENSIIGDNCLIFQNVTIGSAWKKGKCESEAPVIGDNVFIGAGAVILGNIHIGNNVTIGANAVILQDIPDNVVVVGVPGRIVRKK